MGGRHEGARSLRPSPEPSHRLITRYLSSSLLGRPRTNYVRSNLLNVYVPRIRSHIPRIPHLSRTLRLLEFQHPL